MIVNFVVVLSVLLGCCALALDIGLLQLKQLQIQTAADAAALGAIFEMERGKTDYSAAAIAEAGQNGFTNGTNNITVTTNVAPTSGIYANNLSAAQVNVSQTVPSLFHGGTYKISATASAILPPCVYFMSRNPQVTTLTVANSTVHIHCAVYAGYNANTNAGVVVSFDALYLGGPYSASSLNGTVLAGSPGYYPTFNVPITPDPLSYIPAPVFAACDPSLVNTKIQSGYTILFPGTYCGGITITGGTVLFSPGLYVITGGAAWSNATILGSGVTFFLTHGGGSGFGQFNVGANTTVQLSAPTSGSLSSIVLFGDRSWTGSTKDVVFSGANLTVDGIFYMTNTGMSFTNGSLNSQNYFGMVLDNFTLSGSTANIQGNYAGVSGGNPYRPGVGLAE